MCRRAAVHAVLCLALAVSVSLGSFGSLGRARAADNPAVTVDRLYHEAAEAVRSYETVRAAVDRKRRELAALRHAQAVQRRQLGPLRERIGEMARRQYRDGGLPPSARLFLSGAPDELLAGATLLREGDHATAGLLDARDRAQRRLHTATVAADRVLDRLTADAARQAAIKRRIEAKLTRAEAVLRMQQEQQEQQERRQATPHAHAPGQDCPHGPRTPGTERPRHRPSPPGAHTPATWVSPVEHYRLTAGFASTGTHWAHRHTGQDFAVPVGTPVRAVGDGTVVLAGCGDGFGNQIVIQHPCGYYTQYAHLSLLEVEPGDRVRTGDRIGLSGSSGNSTGPHLHFEVRVTPLLGSGVDPVPWMAEHGVVLQDTP
ncbi:M23 family metallopeptidase [Streptomyces sp. NBC_01537]|uniref:M23 family metallopeptidase n=1 Tax=Streptomyces sp. NBC_01537 TaxID=2903896 RepID=UPI003864FA68